MSSVLVTGIARQTFIKQDKYVGIEKSAVGIGHSGDIGRNAVVR